MKKTGGSLKFRSHPEGRELLDQMGQDLTEHICKKIAQLEDEDILTLYHALADPE